MERTSRGSGAWVACVLLVKIKCRQRQTTCDPRLLQDREHHVLLAQRARLLDLQLLGKRQQLR
jgi:hypothetical protein